jgi:hypothetical protein
LRALRAKERPATLRNTLPIRNAMDRTTPTVLAIAILLSSVAAGRTAQPRSGEEEAIDEIQELGARIAFDEENPAKPVIAVNFYGTKVTDAGLESLKDLTQLQRLQLGDTNVTDAGLAHLTRLTRLKKLYLPATRVTDAGMAHLQGLTQLQTLDLCGTKVADAGLQHLTRLTQLKELDLRSTKVTDAGLVHLKGLTQPRI